MDSLARVLMHERDLLEALLFRLEEAALVVGGDHDRWWGRAARDLDEAVLTVRRTELLRAVAALEAALELGAEPGATLRALAAAADQPVRDLLLDHREAIRALSAEIGVAAQRLRVVTAEQHAHLVRRPGVVCDLPSLEAFLR